VVTIGFYKVSCRWEDFIMTVAHTHIDQDSRFIGMAQAIRFSSMGELMLRRWVKEGRLRLYKVSRKKVLIDRLELEAAIRANAVLNGD
jgi:hypothetical protein